MLLDQIMNRTHERAGAAISNFGQELAQPDPDPAQQIAEDPSVFGLIAEAEDLN